MTTFVRDGRLFEGIMGALQKEFDEGAAAKGNIVLSASRRTWAEHAGSLAPFVEAITIETDFGRITLKETDASSGLFYLSRENALGGILVSDAMADQAEKAR